jgi:hypothetical protein
MHRDFFCTMFLFPQFPAITVSVPTTEPFVGIGADLAFNAQEHTNKTLTTRPFSNTYEVDEVSPEVEAGVVSGLKCLKP